MNVFKKTFFLAFVVMLIFTLSFLATPASAAWRSSYDINLSIKNGEFGIVGNDTNTTNPPNSGIVGIPVDNGAAADMPNLAEGTLGFSIELWMRVADEEAAQKAANAMNSDGTYVDKEASLWQTVVITEIMWGLDGDSDEAQWIEIFNSSGVNIAAEYLRLFYWNFSDPDNFSPGGYVISTDGQNNQTYWVQVDYVSNINRFGQLWDLKGQSGNTSLTGDPAGSTLSPIISMYRKANIKDGTYEIEDRRLKGLGSGREESSWAESEERINMAGAYYVGSPGSVHVDSAVFTKTPASLPVGTVMINEVRNDTSSKNLDWVELINNALPGPSVDPVDVNNYTLGLVTGVGSDAEKHTLLATIPKHKMAPGDYLVIYNRDPREAGMDLAPGISVRDLNEQTALTQKERRVNSGATHWYIYDRDLKLPSTGEFLIILRSGNDKTNHEKVVDFTGNGFFPLTNTDIDTDVYPFIAWTTDDVKDAEAFGGNTFASTNQSWGRTAELVKTPSGSVWRAKSGANRVHKDHWQYFMRMGGIGYDRGKDSEITPGTPGYLNVNPNLVIDDRETSAKTDDYMADGTVTISEIMYDAGPRWNLVQWIELYNSSMVQGIDIGGWELEIRNKGDNVESFVDSSFEFDANTVIPPNQTLLLVSGPANTSVPENRIYNLFQRHARDLGLRGRDTRLLSPIGFYLKLTAKTKQDADGREKLDYVMDEAGNVDASKGNVRTDLWAADGGMYPVSSSDESRRSLVRLYGGKFKTKGNEKGTGPNDAEKGQMKDSWRCLGCHGLRSRLLRT